MSPQPEFDFVGGSRCVDFANEHGLLAGDDAVRSYDNLLRWSRDAGALTVEQVRRLRQRARQRLGRDLVAINERAGRLGEALRGILVAAAADSEPRLRDLATVNRELSNALGRLAIVGRGPGFHLDWTAGEADLDRPLWEVVRSAADLLVSDRLRRLKVCDADTCRYLFVDSSKSGRRRWCDMNVCGNRAKARRFRERRSGA